MLSLQEIEIYAKKNYVPIIREQSRKLLIKIIKKHNSKNILEIGTAIGFSGIIILQNTIEQSFLTTIDNNHERLLLARQNFIDFNLIDRVKIIENDATETIKKLSNENNHFDFIFLDGPKSHYLLQLPYLLQLLDKNGVILVDNINFMGEVLTDHYPKHKHRTTIFKLRNFINAVKNNLMLNYEIKNIEDGLMIIQKK